MFLFHLGVVLTDDPGALWSIPAGLGVVLVAWQRPWIAVLLGVDIFLCRWLIADRGLLAACSGALLLPLQFLVSWWTYHKWAKGVRELDDPRSAILFLLLVPGFWCGIFACLRMLIDHPLDGAFWFQLGVNWLRDALGILALAPPLLVVLTRFLVQSGFADDEPVKLRSTRDGLADWTFAEILETTGLACGAGILSIIIAQLQAREYSLSWQLWGIAMIVVVWSGLRQGLRGSAIAAAVAAVAGLCVTGIGMNPAAAWALRGALLAQCSTALLVGAALGWMRASETRYRQVIDHIPIVLYSVRIPRMLAARLFRGITQKTLMQGREKRMFLPELIEVAELILVSPASRQILGYVADELIGPYDAWLKRIHNDDREVVFAALAQVCLQRSAVTCEYRLALSASSTTPQQDRHLFGIEGIFPRHERQRWIRDTLVPHFDADGRLDGWDGIVEDITEQRILAVDLRRTTAMLNALVANLPTGIFFVHGPQGQPVLVNNRARQLLGQREDLSAGVDHLANVYRLHRPDGSRYPASELPVTRALREGRSCTADDIVVHRADGRHIPLITWAAPVELDSTGQINAAVWVIEDLNTVKKAQVAREQSQARLRAIIETMAEGLIVQDEQGAIVECNAAAGNILGVVSAELIGKSALAARCLREDGSDCPRDEHPDRLVLQNTAPVRNLNMEIERPGPNGEVERRWLLLNATLLAPGWPDYRPRVVTTFSDITEQRRTLAAVHEAKDKYQHLLESLPLVVLQITHDGRIHYINPAAQQILGVALDTPAETDLWHSRIMPDDRIHFNRALQHALGGYHSRVEFRYRAGNETDKHLYALLQPALDHANSAACTCIAVDMTLQRHLEQELQRSQRLEIVGRLASGTVHDLNNLITVMVGMAGLAQMRLAEDHPLRSELGQIMEVGEQAGHLAGQLLTFSKRRQQSFQTVELNNSIQQTVKILKSAFHGRAELIIDLAMTPMPIHADDTQLKQLILNLGLNARDAMPKGGTLTIRTRLDDESGVILELEDTGQGMAEEVRKRLFEPFFTTKERGSGLGLVVVRQIVDNFGGRISVFSEPNKGTRFEIWLPLRS